jgi:hypothetical protein
MFPLLSKVLPFFVYPLGLSLGGLEIRPGPRRRPLGPLP